MVELLRLQHPVIDVGDWASGQLLGSLVLPTRNSKSSNVGAAASPATPRVARIVITAPESFAPRGVRSRRTPIHAAASIVAQSAQ